jgi:hypothetical protein
VSERKKCQRVGHKWLVSVDGYQLPFQFCGRWFCDGSRAAPWFAAVIPAAEEIVKKRRSEPK